MQLSECHLPTSLLLPFTPGIDREALGAVILLSTDDIVSYLEAVDSPGYVVHLLAYPHLLLFLLKQLFSPGGLFATILKRLANDRWTNLSEMYRK